MLFTEVMKNNKDFMSTYRRGRTVSCRLGVLSYRPNGLGFNRLGITVGKKVGKAHDRVRVRRIVRAAYRNAESALPIGYDIVFNAKAEAVFAKSDEVESFLKGKAAREMNKPFKAKSGGGRQGGRAEKGSQKPTSGSAAGNPSDKK